MFDGQTIYRNFDHFTFPGTSGLYFFVRPTDYTRPEQVTDLIQGLEAHQVRSVSWYPGLDGRGFDPRTDHLGPLREYMRAHYHVAMQVANRDKMWQRDR